jgi:hypothetical protein
MNFTLTNQQGNFIPGNRGFLGLRFGPFAPSDTHLEPHYAWIEMEHARVFGYAVESTPGKSIRAGQVPEPSSLSLLALGAIGVLARRRRKAERGQAEVVPATA